MRRTTWIEMLDNPRAILVNCLVALGLATLAGCASGTVVKVDSLTKPNAENAISYRIKHVDLTSSPDSLRHQEAAGYVRTALSGKGMFEAPAGVEPDVVVQLDYGMGPPQTRREIVTTPIYETVPGQTRTQTVQSGTNAQGQPVYSTVTTRGPDRTRFVGYERHEVVTTTYEKYLKLSARENKEASEGKPPAEVWTVDVTSEGESRNLRQQLPVLVAASLDYVGKDSQGQKTIRIKDSDPAIAFVKKGMN